ncbi:hypothetical protein AB3Z07_05115 [Metabacillus halosaccharovorans]|uniref:hypothetical protein n=1 Tax=Metabacillus halosaccharovorans TaxID=930124 RepID=UPI0034CE4198
MATNQNNPTYFGNSVDIGLAKQNGVQGNFVDISNYGAQSKINDIKRSYKSGANPILLGGNQAKGGITDYVESQLRSQGMNINRIGGDTRIDVQNALNRVDTNNKINSLYDQQKKAQETQANNLAPQYQAQRNQADVVNQQNVQKLREIMAASGLAGSGENVTANVGLQSQRQSSLNDINLQEQQAVNDINQKILELEAQRTQALLESDRYLDERDYQYNRDKVEDNRYSQQWNYQKQQDDRQWNYQLNRDKVEDNRYTQEQAYRKQQDAAERAWREYTYKNMSATEKAQLEWAKSQYGEDAAWRMFELNYNGELQKSMNDANIDFYQSQGFPIP